MKRIKSLAMSSVYGIGVAFWALTVAAQPNVAARPSSDPRVVVQFDEASLSKGSIEFQRGVFRIEEGGQRIAKLCIPVKGQWKQVGDMHDCGNPPPPAQQREIVQFSPDVTFLGVRNLGVDSTQWGAAHKMNGSANPNNPLLKVSKAFSFTIDSRVSFVGSYLAPGTKYVEDVENHQRSGPWAGMDRFAFKLTRDNVRRILADANARRRAAGAELFDERRLDQIKVAGVTLRNESRFLDDGDLEIQVAVDYLRVVRVR